MSLNSPSVFYKCNEPLDYISPFKVYLDGEMDPTSWRKTKAIPFLKKHQIKFYDPQEIEWNPNIINIQNEERDSCDIILFVIDSSVPAIHSSINAMKHIYETPNKLVIVVESWIPFDNTNPVFIHEVNKARKNIVQIADDNGVYVHSNINDALVCISKLKECRRCRFITS